MIDRLSSSESPLSADGVDPAEVERRVVRWWHPLLLLLALAALYLVGQWLGIREELIRLHGWIESLGALGPFAFILLYVVVTVLGFPGSPLTAAAGALFGSTLGAATSLTASTGAMTISFLISRHLVSGRVRRRLTGNRKFQQLDRLITRRGALVVFATRLVNLLPFAVVNYGFGLTRVRLGTYVFWSLLGKIPGTLVIVLGVDVIVEVLRGQRIPWLQVALVVAVALVLALAVRRINRWLSDNDDAETSSS